MQGQIIQKDGGVISIRKKRPQDKQYSKDEERIFSWQKKFFID